MESPGALSFCLFDGIPIVSLILSCEMWEWNLGKYAQVQYLQGLNGVLRVQCEVDILTLEIPFALFRIYWYLYYNVHWTLVANKWETKTIYKETYGIMNYELLFGNEVNLFALESLGIGLVLTHHHHRGMKHPWWNYSRGHWHVRRHHVLSGSKKVNRRKNARYEGASS